MKPLYSFLDTVRDAVKKYLMRPIARALNTLSGGRITPNAITYTGLLMHLVIAWQIATGDFNRGAVLLIIFGLFDALDGELARLQNRSSAGGMLLDSVTDRMKEVLLYCGIAYALVADGQSFYAVWALAACGGSLLTSYVNAWGEATMARHPGGSHTMNSSFRGSLMRFEVRMFVLVLGLFTGQLDVTVVVIAVLAWFTAIERLVKVGRRLDAQN